MVLKLMQQTLCFTDYCIGHLKVFVISGVHLSACKFDAGSDFFIRFPYSSRRNTLFKLTVIDSN